MRHAFEHAPTNDEWASMDAAEQRRVLVGFAENGVTAASGGAPYDLFNQALMTELVVKPLVTQYEDQPRLGYRIAPLRPFAGTEAKLRTRQTLAFGKGQFRALDAPPPLYKPQQIWEERLIGLVPLDEMIAIREKEYMQLNSADETVARAAGIDILENGRILAIRNERLTQWMIWQAFSGTLTIPFDTGGRMFVDYLIPASNKPTASVLWSDTTNADPIADIRTWANLLARQSGFYGIHLHMSSSTYDYIVNNAKIRALLTDTGRTMKIPTLDDVINLLRGGTDITLYDDGYRDDSVGSARGVPDSLTQYLPDGFVLMTTEYNLDGIRIAETLDGLVTVSTGYNTVAILQGPQSEVMLDHKIKTHLWRQASMRIPRINVPEAFLYARVA